MNVTDKAQALETQILNDPYPDEELESLIGQTDFPIREVITAIMRERHPEGFKMVIRSQDEWAAIAEAVNMGIDSHLEAFTKSTFDNGWVWIHPDEMGILLDRLMDVGNKRWTDDDIHHDPNDQDDDHPHNECGGECYVAAPANLVRSIIYVMVQKDED